MLGRNRAFVTEDSVDVNDAGGQNGKKETKSKNNSVSNTHRQGRFSSKEGFLELVLEEGRGIFGTKAHRFRFSWNNYKRSNG